MDGAIFDSAINVIARSMKKGCDFCDIYIENSQHTTIRLSDGKIQNLDIGTNAGVGTRVVSNSSTGYSFCEGLNPTELTRSAEQAISFTKNGQPLDFQGIGKKIQPKRYMIKIPFWETEDLDKIQLLFIADKIARSVHESVLQVSVMYRDWKKEFYILNSDSLFLREETFLLEFAVKVIAGRGNRYQKSVRTHAGIYGLEELNTEKVEYMSREAARTAVTFLDAIPAPTGKMPVVIENGKHGGGVLVHEAIGHALESDYIESGSSLYTGLLGKQIGSRLVTVIDDATLIPNSGCYYHDDEGTPAQRTVLIREGVIENYLTDLIGSRHLGMEPTGNGRRENFRYYPIPRMTSTFIDNGIDDPEDIIKQVDSGLYVRALGGGHGDTSGAGFAFNVAEGYLIENGKITKPVQGATLIGKGTDVLKNIFAVGNNLAHSGAGRCGKIQQVPVTCGQPMIGIKDLLVGGTDA